MLGLGSGPHFSCPLINKHGSIGKRCEGYGVIRSVFHPISSELVPSGPAISVLGVPSVTHKFQHGPQYKSGLLARALKIFFPVEE